MPWWFAYFTQSLVTWVWFRTLVYTRGDRGLFDLCFNRAEQEMADGQGAGTLQVTHAGRHPRVTYPSRGRLTTCEVRWWVVRRIRSLAPQFGPGGGGGPDDAVGGLGRDARVPRPPESGLTPCTVVQDCFRLMDPCLATLARTERLALFHDLRFTEQEPDALPEECAPVILAAYALTDADLLAWHDGHQAAARNAARCRGRQRLDNCMIQRHGPDWRLVLVGPESGGAL
jgi:hypothetical protein